MKRRKGEALIEAVFGVVVFGLVTFVLASAFGMNAQAQVSVQTQYNMLSVNAFVSDVYEMYKGGAVLETQGGESDDTGHSSFVATMVAEDGRSKAFSYDASTQWVTVEGTKVFKASMLEFSQSAQSLYIALKVKEQHLIELEVFR